MPSTASQSSSTFHLFINNKNTSVETENKLDFISSIWYYDQILRLDEKNQQCLWFNTSLQGINTNKAFVHLLGKKSMHIKSCYVPNDKAHITRYQELQNSKQTQKGVLLDYSENVKASISSLQNKSSSSIKSTIHCSYKSITSSNDTNSYENPGFNYAPNITTESKPRSFSNDSSVLGLMAILKY